MHNSSQRCCFYIGYGRINLTERILYQIPVHVNPFLRISAAEKRSDHMTAPPSAFFSLYRPFTTFPAVTVSLPSSIMSLSATSAMNSPLVGLSFLP